MDKVSYSSDGGLFNLPWIVAEREGFFREENLDVELVHRDPAESRSDCFSRKKETDFATGRTQIYTVCQWGGIKRTAEAKGGRIAFRMPVDGRYTLVASPRSGISTLRELASVPVAVSWDAGSHYAAVEALEAALPPGEVDVKHVGASLARLEALLSEDVKAAVLIEPYTSIALKRDGHLLVHCRPDPGLVIAAESLDRELLQRFARASNRAVELINSAPERYVDVLLEEVPEELREDDIDLPRFTEMSAALSQDEFEQTQDWMLQRGMLTDPAEYRDVVLSSSR